MAVELRSANLCCRNKQGVPEAAVRYLAGSLEEEEEVVEEPVI